MKRRPAGIIAEWLPFTSRRRLHRGSLGRIEEIAHPPRTQVQFPVPMAMAPRQASAVPVEAGALQVSAEVEITWALE